MAGIFLLLAVVATTATQVSAVSFFKETQFRGAGFSVGSIVPGICYEFLEFNDQTVSLQAEGQCLTAFEHNSCQGASVNLGPGGHLNLGGWEKRITSFSLRSCDGQPIVAPKPTPSSAPPTAAPTTTTTRSSSSSSGVNPGPGSFIGSRKIEEAGKPPNFKTTQELNKEIVLAFYRELFTEHRLDSVDKYIDAGPENYIRHNPFVTSGREIFKSNFEKWLTEPWSTDVLRIAADGDLVFVHNRVESKFFNAALGADKYVVIVDIFRMENGKLREHWDVLQAVPPANRTVNPNTMW